MAQENAAAMGKSVTPTRLNTNQPADVPRISVAAPAALAPNSSCNRR